MYIGQTCRTPMHLCTGANVTDGIGKGRVKYHNTPKEGLRCFGKYLESQGFVKHNGNSREWKRPDNGMIEILPKKMGSPVMTGKSGEKGGGRSKRTHAKHRNILG